MNEALKIICTDKANSSWIGGLEGGRGAQVDLISISLRLRFDSTLPSDVHSDFTSISFRFHSDATSMSFRFDLKLTSISIRCHFDFTSEHFHATPISHGCHFGFFNPSSRPFHFCRFEFSSLSLRFHFEFTSNALRLQLGFTSISHRFHLEVTSI